MTFFDQILITFVTALFTASATAAFAYFGFWRQAKAELQKEYESRFNEKKWEIYIKFMELIPLIRQVSEDIINQREAKSEYREFYWSSDDLISNEELMMKKAEWLKDEILSNDESLHDELQDIEQKLLLIGSSYTMKKFLTWRSYSENNPTFEDEEGVKLFINLINTMREDLGNIKSKLDPNDFDGIYFVSEKRKRGNEKWRKQQGGKYSDIDTEGLIEHFIQMKGIDHSKDLTQEQVRELDEYISNHIKQYLRQN